MATRKTAKQLMVEAARMTEKIGQLMTRRADLEERLADALRRERHEERGASGAERAAHWGSAVAGRQTPMSSGREG